MKEELSDFLKIAYKYGRVKDLKGAFVEAADINTSDDITAADLSGVLLKMVE